MCPKRVGCSAVNSTHFIRRSISWHCPSPLSPLPIVQDWNEPQRCTLVLYSRTSLRDLKTDRPDFSRLCEAGGSAASLPSVAT